ncbi:hypothetical protein WJX73_003714 [Symbiochloris irregularis]|uniref:Methyltransferase type 11 domain-containing protein n=1 Tax=Symbiochloris irregularis TaxID=706552 RepID=A0AAW1NTW6_9CHLO
MPGSRSTHFVRCQPSLRRSQSIRCQKPEVGSTEERSSRIVTRRLLSGGGCCCGLCALVKPTLAKSVTLDDGFTYDAGFAYGMAYGMLDYENKVQDRKQKLFAEAFDGLDSPSVVDIGMGTGPNLPFYSKQKGIKITGIDPNLAMDSFAQENAEAQGLQPDQLKLAAGRAEKLPLPDSSFDVAVCTLVLCSVDSVEASLREVKRVLKPGGKLVFMEHVLAPSSSFLLQIAQQVFNPLQGALAHGCHLNRNPEPYMAPAGLSVKHADRFFVEGEAFISPHVAGIATAQQA